MTDEVLAALLANLKVDLGIMTTAYDERLKWYIQSADTSIKEEGAVMDYSDIRDCQLVTMYAAWTWRKRESGEGMPRMLRYALNNKIFAKKMR